MSNERIDVLDEMDVVGRMVMRDCECPDPIACVQCDSAKPIYAARAAVAELIAATDEVLTVKSGTADEVFAMARLHKARGGITP